MTKSLIWCLSFLNSECVLLANMLYFSNPEMIIRSMSESDVRSSVEAEREQSFLASPEKYFTRLKDFE